MGLINLDQALGILGKHMGPMRYGVETAWGEIQKYPERLKLVHDATARANNMACEMRYAATQYFCQQSDVRICNPRRATLYVVGERIALRYKKLDRWLLAQNLPTYQALAIAHQQAVETVGSVTFLNVGYVLDQAERELERICLTCPNGDDRNYWEYDLQKSEDITKIRDLFPLADEDEPETKVRGKTDSTDSEGSADEDNP